MAEWLLRWTTKLATRVRSPVAVELSTDYSVVGGNLTIETVLLSTNNICFG